MTSAPAPTQSTEPTRATRARLVLTIGGSPLPVLAALLALQPHEAIGIVTEESADTWQRCLRTYERVSGHQLKATSKDVPAHNLTSVETTSSSCLGDGSGDVVYTGGTPAMSAGLIQAFLKRNPHERGTAWYVAEAGDALWGDQGQIKLVEPAALQLSDFLYLHDAEPRSHSSSSPPPPREAAPAPDPRRLHHRLNQLPKHVAPKDAQKESDQLVKMLAEALATVFQEVPGVNVYAMPGIRWALPRGNDIHIAYQGVVVTSGLHAYVIATPGYHAASRHSSGAARTSWRTGDLKERLFDAMLVARQIGGTHGRAAVLEPTRGESLARANLWQDLGPEVTPDDLPRTDGAERLPGVPQFHAFDLTAITESLAGWIAGLDDQTELLDWLMGR